MRISSLVGVILSLISLTLAIYLFYLGIRLRKDDEEGYGALYEIYGLISAIGVLQTIMSLYFLFYCLFTSRKVKKV